MNLKMIDMENNVKDFIKEAWEENAEKFKTSHWSSWGDSYCIKLEINEISKHLKNNSKVLDLGCANAFPLINQLQKNSSLCMHGIDFSERMIHYARKNLEEFLLNQKLPKNFYKPQVDVGDIRDIKHDNDFFDITYTTRTLINLPNWEDQKKGISECLRVTKSGGKVLLSEAFWEPLVLLNSLRTLKNLEPLVEHDFNRYLKITKLKDFLDSLKLCYRIIEFSSVYYLGSRFLRELITDFKNYEGYENPINKLFFDMENQYSGGGFGIQQLVVIEK